MKSKSHNRRSSPLKAAMLAAGAATLLLTTGCGAPAAAPEATQAPATSAPATAATSSPSASATKSASGKGAMGQDKYSERLVPDRLLLKAGDTLHLSGGGDLTPGSTLQLYASQQRTVAYNEKTGMWGATNDEVILTDKVNAVVDAQGHYDVDLLIPAGTAPQTMNVDMIAPDGRGNLVQVTVR